MTLKKGDQAPTFKLYNPAKKEISLDDYKGKNLIIHFFPAAFTSTCTRQLCTVRDGISMYSNDKVDVVAISVDMPFTLGKFKADQNLNFELLSDFNKEVSQAYDAFYETWILNLRGVSRRAVFVLDRDHKVVHSEVLESANDFPDFGKIDAALASLN